MKKSLYLALLSLAMAFFSLGNPASTVLASSRQSSTTNHISTASVQRGRRFCFPHCRTAYNQYFHGNAYSGLHETFRGHNLNNGGSQGHNRGRMIGYGANAGNLIVSRHRLSPYSSVNQHFSGNAYSRNRFHFVGYNQNNVGNQGLNEGYNEDHSANAGNQFVN